MSEERRAAPAPDATVPDMGPASSTSEVAASKTSDADQSDARRAQRDSSASARRRARTLRIPDDEVARPTQAAATSEPPPAVQPAKSAPPPAAPVARSAPPPAAPVAAAPPAAPIAKSAPPPALEPPAGVLTPMRIITINPPPASPDAPVLDVVAARSYPPEAETREQLPSEEIPIDTDGEAPPPSSEPAESIDPIEDAPPPPPPARPLAPTEPEGEDVAFDDYAPAAAAPPAAPARAVASSPPPAAPSVPAGERSSDPGAEVDAEDMVAEEPPAAAKAQALVQPPVPPPVKKATAPTLTKPPLVIVPPHMGTIAPQRHETEGSGLRRKGRLWWEELFNDDFLRTSEKLTDEQIAREVDFIEDSLSIEKHGAMLDLACGTGRHAIELARRGYEVVGFDLALAMLARAGDEAQDRDAKLNFVQGDMRDMTFEEQFDGVYCWNTSFGYFEEDRNAQVIDRIHRALKAEGRLLLDVANRDFLVRQSPSLAWFEGEGCVCMDEMSFDFITSRMRVKRTIMLDDGRSREIEYSMRVYSLHELGKLLHEHGFKVCEVSGRIATPGVFFGNESPRTIILAEKR
jgi:SAM-dependent methyltransferase